MKTLLVTGGAGFIGVSFAAILSDSGWIVVLVDPDAARREAALVVVKYSIRVLFFW